MASAQSLVSSFLSSNNSVMQRRVRDVSFGLQPARSASAPTNSSPESRSGVGATAQRHHVVRPGAGDERAPSGRRVVLQRVPSRECCSTLVSGRNRVFPDSEAARPLVGRKPWPDAAILWAEARPSHDRPAVHPGLRGQSRAWPAREPRGAGAHRPAPEKRLTDRTYSLRAAENLQNYYSSFAKQQITDF